MGNNAVIKTRTGHIGMYLHWNGGRDSVNAFLTYCKMRGFRSPEYDGYGWARLAQVVGNFFGGGLSVGMVEVNAHGCLSGDGKGCDNGCYVNEKWEIVDRQDFEGCEQNNYDLTEMLVSIDEAQPESERMGEYITAREVATADLKEGDTVFYMDRVTGQFKSAVVVGFGADRWVNGTNVNGLPYIDRFGNDLPEDNINNYITDERVRVK